jgi:hypothetical protein
MGPPQPPSLELPKPPADLRGVRKGDHVMLAWTIPSQTTDRERVRSLGVTRVCRGKETVLSDCGVAVGQVAAPSSVKPSAAQKISATYSELLPSQLRAEDPFGFVTYAVEVLNADGRGAGLSNQVQVPLAAALPAPKDLAAQVTAKGIELSWTGVPLSLPSPYRVRQSYRVFRRTEGSPEQVLVGQHEAGIDIQQSLTDQSFEWEKTYYYHADTLTVIAQPGKPEVQIAGDDTAEVKVFADDVFPPAVPGGLQAAFSGPGQAAFIDLIWAPVTDVDLDGYNVYRREDGGAAVKVNKELVKAPAYRDANIASGKEYFYSVSAVDVRGNESARSEEAEETVPTAAP